MTDDEDQDDRAQWSDRVNDSKWEPRIKDEKTTFNTSMRLAARTHISAEEEARIALHEQAKIGQQGTWRAFDIKAPLCKRERHVTPPIDPHRQMVREPKS